MHNANCIFVLLDLSRPEEDSFFSSLLLLLLLVYNKFILQIWTNIKFKLFRPTKTPFANHQTLLNADRVCCSWFPETLICDCQISFTNFDLRYWRQTINKMQFHSGNMGVLSSKCSWCVGIFYSIFTLNMYWARKLAATTGYVWSFSNSQSSRGNTFSLPFRMHIGISNFIFSSLNSFQWI